MWFSEKLRFELKKVYYQETKGCTFSREKDSYCAQKWACKKVIGNCKMGYY